MAGFGRVRPYAGCDGDAPCRFGARLLTQPERPTFRRPATHVPHTGHDDQESAKPGSAALVAVFAVQGNMPALRLGIAPGERETSYDYYSQLNDLVAG